MAYTAFINSGSTHNELKEDNPMTYRVIDVDPIEEQHGDYSTIVGFRTSDGKTITQFDGCDWKDDTTEIINKLTKDMKEGDEIVELFDGDDTLHYGILRAQQE